MSLLILRTGLAGVPGDAVGGQVAWAGPGVLDFLVVPASRRMPRRQPTFTIQPPSGAGPRPLGAAAGPAQPDPAHPRPVPPSMDPPRDHKVIGDNGTYRANAPTDSSMSRSLTTR